MDLTADREEAVVGLPEDRILRRNIGRDIVLDLSTDEKEFEARMFPLSRVFDWFDVGELYGSAVESRSARDFLEVTAWLDGGAEPTTIRETVFRSDRLKTMRLRVSAAYKGVHALLMSQGAKDSARARNTATLFSSIKPWISILSSQEVVRGSAHQAKRIRLDRQQNAFEFQDQQENWRLSSFRIPAAIGAEWEGGSHIRSRKAGCIPANSSHRPRSPAIGQLPRLYGGPATRLTLIDRASDWEGGVCRSGRRGRYGLAVWRGRGGRVTSQPACAVGGRKRFHARGTIARSST